MAKTSPSQWNLNIGNAVRARRAADRQAPRAKRAWPKLHAAALRARLPQQQRSLTRQAAAVKLRAQHPRASLTRLAAKAGMTKDAYAALLRRGLENAQ